MTTEEKHSILVAALNRKLADRGVAPFEVKDFNITIDEISDPRFTHVARLVLNRQNFIGAYRLYYNENAPQIVTSLEPV